jgi:hypothetical protein
MTRVTRLVSTLLVHAVLAMAAGLAAALVAPVWSDQALAAPSANTSAGNAVMMVVDTSGSMSEDDGKGTIKLEGAKTAILNVVGSLPANALVGLRSYPTPGNSCDPGINRYGLTQPDNTELTTQIRAMTAGGDTPSALALRAAADDLLTTGHAATIVFVSDGQSNCGGDPCAMAKQIAAEGIALTVNTVGFQITKTGSDELKCIAEATAGQYFDASDSNALQQAVDQAAVPRIELTLDSPRPNELVAAGGLVTITATVRNTAKVHVEDVRTMVAFPAVAGMDNRDPGVIGPLRNLGNLGVAEHRQVQWQYRAPADQAITVSTFVIRAAATNASPVRSQGTVHYASGLDLSNAGNLLRQARHPVIVGDSYSSGEGAGDYEQGTDGNGGNRCHRSPHTYATMLTWPEGLTNLACSGAVTSDIEYRNNDNTDEAAQANQLHALRGRADLVLMTIGGNDIGFVDIIKHCALTWSCHREPVHPAANLSGDCLTSYAKSGRVQGQRRHR